MKKILLFLLIAAANQSFAQFTCDSIHFTSTNEVVNLPTNDDLWMKYTYDELNNPLISYPFFYIVLNDTSEVVVRDEVVGSLLGNTDSVLFTVIYKNPLTPDGYTVDGTFDIHDPNATPTLLCQFPFTLTVNNASVSLQENESNEVSISPNPVSDIVSIRSEKAIQEIVVVNTLGQEVHRMDGNQSTQMNIDLSLLDSGCYRLMIFSENEIATSSILRD